LPNTNCLQLRAAIPVRAQNAGLFISKREWLHSTRTIDSFELIFVRQGILSIHERDEVYRVEPGQALLLWPEREHGGIEPTTEDLHFYWVHFTLDGSNTSEDGAVISIPRLCAVSRPDRLIGLFRRFLDDQESKRLDQVSADMLVMLMLNHLALSDTFHDYPNGTETLVVQRAEAYIKTNFDKHLNTSSLAQALDYNADYLGRAFRRVRGTTLTAFLQGERLSHARELLMEGTKSITEVARACGFEDASYFRRVFHRHEGMSPLAYRRLYARAYVNTM